MSPFVLFSSRYAGTLLGITNTFGTIPGVLAPIVVGYLTRDVRCVLYFVTLQLLKIIHHHQSSIFICSPFLWFLSSTQLQDGDMCSGCQQGWAPLEPSFTWSLALERFRAGLGPMRSQTQIYTIKHSSWPIQKDMRTLPLSFMLYSTHMLQSMVWTNFIPFHFF